MKENEIYVFYQISMEIGFIQTSFKSNSYALWILPSFCFWYFHSFPYFKEKIDK